MPRADVAHLDVAQDLIPKWAGKDALLQVLTVQRMRRRSPRSLLLFQPQVSECLQRDVPIYQGVNTLQDRSAVHLGLKIIGGFLRLEELPSQALLPPIDIPAVVSVDFRPFRFSGHAFLLMCSCTLASTSQPMRNASTATIASVIIQSSLPLRRLQTVSHARPTTRLTGISPLSTLAIVFQCRSSRIASCLCVSPAAFRSLRSCVPVMDTSIRQC